MADVKKQLGDELAAQSALWDERYQPLLPQTDDLSLVVLKGHLIIEEILFAIVQKHCAHPEQIGKARLSFAQLLELTKALMIFPTDIELWTSIAFLNSLRNALVHNLEPKAIEEKAKELRNHCRSKNHEFESETKPARIARGAICFIIGQLTALGAVSAFQLRTLRLADPDVAV